MVRTVTATRYAAPLREGGSLPAIVEADDDGLYVVKFHGAGQGPRALIAELVAGEIGRALGLPVPEIVFADVDPILGRSEPDPEIQELVLASGGLNVGLDYLPGSLDFSPLLVPPPDSELASAIVWFDAYVTNVDRSPRNPNMLLWHKQLYLIDHGSALYFHHSWKDYRERSHDPFSHIQDHVLLPIADNIREADADLRERMANVDIGAIIDLIPEKWLDEDIFATPAEHRAAYVTYLQERLLAPRQFVEEALDARARLV